MISRIGNTYFFFHTDFLSLIEFLFYTHILSLLCVYENSREVPVVLEQTPNSLLFVVGGESIISAV